MAKNVSPKQNELKTGFYPPSEACFCCFVEYLNVEKMEENDDNKAR